MKRLQVSAAGLSLLVCFAAFGQTVKVNWNAKTQFAKYKTYSWKASANPGNPLFAQWVQPDVDDQLAARGIQILYPGQNPDLYLIYSIHTLETEDATTTMEGYGWGDGPWTGWGGWNTDGETEGVPAVGTVTTDHPRTLGILTVDMVDVKKKVVVWRGQGTVEHMSKSDRKDAEQVKKIVVKMFQQFPPK